MSRTSLIGSLGIARQSAKDSAVAAALLNYVPMTTVGLAPQQNTATLPPEIGGAYFPRAAYKTAVSGSGDSGGILRPNGFGHFLMAYAGVDTVTPVPSQVGAYQHVFTPFPVGAGNDLPWFTLGKNVSYLTFEQYMNAKIRSLRMDIPKSGTATFQSSWFATTPSTIAVPGTPTYDTTPQFQTSVGSVGFTQEGGSGNISVYSVKMERFAMTFTNQISEDEFSVGSFYPDDITLLQRTINVDMDFIIRDTSLYAATYFNGQALPSTWQPQLYRGSLTVTLTSTVNVPGTTQPYQLVVNFPGLDFLMMPLPMSGADLIRATLSTQVTLGPNGSDTFAVTLINGVASY